MKTMFYQIPTSTFDNESSICHNFPIWLWTFILLFYLGFVLHYPWCLNEKKKKKKKKKVYIWKLCYKIQIV
jgi:hypothetical protein